jgi:hypothetical protein
MSRQTSFAHQKQILEQFSSLIYSLENELKGLVRKYEEDILSLYEDQGLMDEIYEEYAASYLQPLNSSISDLVARLSEEDVPYIEKEIDIISSR